MYQPLLITVTLLFLNVFSFAQPSGYYDEATGSGYTLKTQLHNIIDGHSSQSYSSLWSHMQSTDADDYYEGSGDVLDMYSENPDGSDPYNFTWGSDQCGNYSGEGSCYNREHSFPKSWFNDGSPMYTDLFHLYPTDGYTNGQRSNYPFGETDNPSWTSMNGTKKGSCSYPGYTGTVFEPIDEFKGDFARTYFYMATRYEDVVSGWSSAVLDGSSDQVYVDWYLQMMKDWHEMDPVSQKEIDRNNEIYTIQNNRNPFIDHPEWVCEIWGGCPVSEEPDNYPTSFTASSGALQIDLTWTDATGTNLPDGYLIKANTAGDFQNPTDGNDPVTDSDLSDGTATVKVLQGNEDYTFTNLNAETTYYFKIWSYANSGSDILFKTDGSAPTAQTATGAAPTALFTDDFEDNLDQWQVTQDSDPDASVYVSNEWSGAEGTTNAAFFDAPNPTDISYFVSTIEHTLTNVRNLSLEFFYYFEDWRGGEITVYLNDVEQYAIYTDGDGDLLVNEGDVGSWTSTTINMADQSETADEYTIKIEGISKCSESWKDRVAIDQLKVYGNHGTGIGAHSNTNFRVYPNPATSQINIDADGVYHLNLISLSGKTVCQKEIRNSGAVKTSHLPKGIYILHLQNTETVFTKKIVIE